MFSSGPNYSKLKTNLRLTINRLKLLEKKKTEIANKSRKEIADYISAGKDDRARIRVEHIIREDYMVEAMELLEMYCDLLLARFGLIQTQKDLDKGLEEAIASILWASPRLQTDILELKVISDQFTSKYGKEFGVACRKNELNNVSDKVIHKLDVQAPPKLLVEKYMIEIANAYNVPFEPDPALMAQSEMYEPGNLIDFGDKKGDGGSGGPSGGIGVGGGASASAPYPPPQTIYSSQQQPAYPPPQVYNNIQPPPVPQSGPVGGIGAGGFVDPSNPQGQQSYDEWLGEDPKKQVQNTPNSNFPPSDPGFNPNTFPDLPAVPTNTLPDPGNSVGGSSAGGDDVDFDDLTRRFEQLKKKK